MPIAASGASTSRTGYTGALLSTLLQAACCPAPALEASRLPALHRRLPARLVKVYLIPVWDRNLSSSNVAEFLQMSNLSNPCAVRRSFPRSSSCSCPSSKKPEGAWGLLS